MLQLLEPKRTNYDLHFPVAGIPVRVHPMFWVMTLLMGVRAENTPLQSFIWIFAAFVSILLHELGHAFAMRYFGYRPWVTLYGFGGLASYDRNESYGYDPVAVFGENYTRFRETRREVLISFAGPAAGFAFAGLIVAVMHFFGGGFEYDFNPQSFIGWHFPGVRNFPLLVLLEDLMFINVFWGLINLLPIYPLDGGQIARELYLAKLGPAGMKPAFQLGLITAIGMALVAVAFWPAENKLFGAIMFGLLAYQNYMLLQAFGKFGGETLESGGRNGGDGRPRQPWESPDDEDDRGW